MKLGNLKLHIFHGEIGRIKFSVASYSNVHQAGGERLSIILIREQADPDFYLWGVRGVGIVDNCPEVLPLTTAPVCIWGTFFLLDLWVLCLMFREGGKSCQSKQKRTQSLPQSLEPCESLIALSRSHFPMVSKSLNKTRPWSQQCWIIWGSVGRI